MKAGYPTKLLAFFPSWPIRQGYFLILMLYCSTILFLPVPTWGEASSSSVITVTTEQDVFDGDTHSPKTLKEYPGRDRAISLREALETANQSPEQVTILFQSQKPTMILRLKAPLPVIQESVVIDGATPQSPVVELHGNGPTSQPPIDGLVLTGNHSAIRGLTITNFSGSGIVIRGDHHLIEGNFIGTDSFGSPEKGNGLNGVTISGNKNQIGRTSSQIRNVISGNMSHGILLKQGTNNRIIGNLIGSHPTNDTARPNAKDGIMILSAQNIIGGTRSLEGNVISGNGENGIHLASTANHTRIQGNILGIDSSLHHVLPNTEDGLYVKSANNLIGGTQPGNGNIIGGNLQSGIEIHQGLNNRIQGNAIGTNRTGQEKWGNQLEGIAIFAHKTIVGGEDSHASNRIAFNQRGGITIPFGQGNTIRGNAIHQNDGLAINLNQDHLTPNDPFDTDLGPNGLQNFPVLTMITARSANDLFIAGQFQSQPTQTYHLDFYASKPDDVLRYQEAYTYLGSETVTTNSKGESPFAIHLPTFVTPGRYVTATATNSEGSTSELAQSVPVQLPNPQIVWQADSAHMLDHHPYQISYTEGMPSIQLLPSDARIVDVDSAELARLTVTLSNPLDGDQEVMTADLQSQALSQSYTHSTLTITGKAPLSIYEEALHSLTYQNLSSAPASVPRLLTIVVSDGNYISKPFTTKITIGGVNNPPTLRWQQVASDETSETYITSYQEGNAPVPLLPATMILTDTDSPQLDWLTATLNNPLDGKQEVLDVRLPDPALTKYFTDGVLTISGAASVEIYQTVLRSVTYHNRSPVPTPTPRIITVVTSDGLLPSSPHTTQVILTSHNTPPILTVNSSVREHPLTFTEGDDSLAFVSPALHIDDEDSQKFTELKVTLNNPLDIDQEILSARLSNAALTQGYSEGTLTITGKASTATYESVLRSLTYLNNQTQPHEGNRNVSITIQDSQGSMSQPHIVQITIKARPHIPPSFTPPFIASLDAVAETIKAEAQQQREDKQLVVKTVTGSGFMVTAGIFIWVLRGTSLIASMWAMIPAWNSIDPLPVLGMSQEDRWKELIDTQQVENQEQEEFPQFQGIFSEQQVSSPLPDKDSRPS